MFKINQICEQGKQKAELDQVDKELKHNPNSVPLLLKRALLIQVQNSDCKYPLTQIEIDLRHALDLFPDSTEILIELAWYYYAVIPSSVNLNECVDKLNIRKIKILDALSKLENGKDGF